MKEYFVECERAEAASSLPSWTSFRRNGSLAPVSSSALSKDLCFFVIKPKSGNWKSFFCNLNARNDSWQNLKGFHYERKRCPVEKCPIRTCRLKKMLIRPFAFVFRGFDSSIVFLWDLYSVSNTHYFFFSKYASALLATKFIQGVLSTHHGILLWCSRYWKCKSAKKH